MISDSFATTTTTKVEHQRRPRGHDISSRRTQHTGLGNDSPAPDQPIDPDHAEPPLPTPTTPGAVLNSTATRSLAQATVVSRAQDGDVAAFTHLVRSYEAELLRLAFRMLTDRGEAQDVVQDALVLAWRKLPTLTDPQAFHAWIYHITTRQCLNFLRARTRRRTDLTSSGEFDSVTRTGSNPGDRGDSPAAAAESSVRQTALNQVLATISADQRACWVLHELHDLSYPETSYAIGVPVSTVRGRIARARQQLAKGMTAWR